MKCCLCAFLVPEKPEHYKDATTGRVYRIGYETIPSVVEYYPRQSPYCRELSADDGGETVCPEVERTCRWFREKEKPCQP